MSRSESITKAGWVVLYSSIFQNGAQRAEIAEKVHKPTLAVNVINFELIGFNSSIWVLWSPSDSKKFYFIDRFKFIRFQ